MLKIAQFTITEEVLINSLLNRFRLASGAHIIVSDGQILIPYEDGEPENSQQKICAIKENKNTMFRELAILEHSQKVNVIQIADAKEAFDVADAKYRKKTNDKALEKAQHRARGRLDELFNADLMNQHEITRLRINLQCYDDQIAELLSQ